MNKVKNILVYLVAMLFLFACSSHSSDATNIAKEVSLASDWVITGLDAPESIIPNSDASFLYVSNVNGEATDKDANGYISKVSFDGKIIEKKWATDLNAPKGLALKDSVLYVSDIDELVLIDTQSGTVLSKVAIADAIFLNDVAVVKDFILISDSATATIHQYKNDELSLWLQDDKLAGVNGIQQMGDEVLITTMQSGTLYKSPIINAQLNKIADGMQNADGIGIISKDSYLISSWPGKLYHVANGEVKLILDTEAEKKYMNDFLLLKDQLLMPNWVPGTLTSYTLK